MSLTVTTAPAAGGSEPSAAFYGSTGAVQLNKSIVGITAAPDGGGYWLVASDGGVFTFGDAHFYGSTGAIHLNKPIVGMDSTPDGKGYWLVASDGGIFAFGDAHFFGSTGAIHLNQPIVSMAASPYGGGYWLVASDGGVFAFGDAQYYGSTGATHLNRPIVGMAAAPDGSGYWLVASDGGVFAFGDAQYYGSTGAIPLNRPIVGMATSNAVAGYWLAANDGGVFTSGPGSGISSTPTTPSPTNPSDEFADPSWTSLPKATASNRTPSCPLNSANYWVCDPPSSAWPLQDPFSPERYLNSAYWPAEERPDIEMYAVQRYGYNYDNCSADLPHYCFLVDAEAVGYPVTHTPAVGDLWVAPGNCLSWEELNGSVESPSTCSDTPNTAWYMGYVEAVLPNGAFIQSWGGTNPTTDSGIELTEFSGAMDPYTDFIGLMPTGSPSPELSHATTLVSR